MIVQRFIGSFLKTLLAIEELSFGTLSRLILRASLLIFIVKCRRAFILRNLILAGRQVGPVAAQALQRLKCF